MAVTTIRGRTRAVVLVLALIGIYVAVVLTYALGGRSDAPDDRAPAANGVLVYLDVDAVSGETFSLQTRVSVYPGANLLDAEGDLRDALNVEVTPAASADSLTFERGTRVGSQPVSLYVDGDIRHWPFDRYRASDVQVLVFSGTGAARRAVPVQVAVTDSVTSWAVDATSTDAGGGKTVDIRATRTDATIGFGIAMCVVLLVLPVCTLFVSIQTLRRRRQFLPPIVTWFAVTLFSVLPIRNLFPGSPPIGSWVDYTVVLWVVMGLAVSLALYITVWWQQGPKP
ncbi:DUF4436 domain-containing protein [Mycolicibacterium madagascariense]|uniref:DUF4436 domain-containing protein n=1 Tax=Mycolicibacterium madagascariense TaxID=212765 RepID=A0A7I7XIC4_9MYCO|nr:DUF4436 family protein [Mycolicibacterium madagascariense]MCV7011119.1 DUF4436 family protein [Mycolicibacterium madagascariense]BBZ28982.1 DUF4436 domain-containing protein [Mycolicibacterium madagascariense]